MTYPLNLGGDFRPLNLGGAPPKNTAKQVISDSTPKFRGRICHPKIYGVRISLRSKIASELRFSLQLRAKLIPTADFSATLESAVKNSQRMAMPMRNFGALGFRLGLCYCYCPQMGPKVGNFFFVLVLFRPTFMSVRNACVLSCMISLN